jgi:hypothetical protein
VRHDSGHFVAMLCGLLAKLLHLSLKRFYRRGVSCL